MKIIKTSNKKHLNQELFKDDQAPLASRRSMLKGVLVGGGALGSALGVAAPLASSPEDPLGAKGAAGVKALSTGYLFFTPSEAAFVEILVDHMVPADAHSPSGSELGINIYVDRALAGKWGRGDKLFMEGPWAKGEPSQGYQLPLTPAQLYRAGIQGTQQHCRRVYQQSFEELSEPNREQLLKDLQANKIDLGELESKPFFDLLYQTMVEGFFSDPIYGGNANKAGWKMLGFPGVIQTHALHITEYKNKPFPVNPLGMEDV